MICRRMCRSHSSYVWGSNPSSWAATVRVWTEDRFWRRTRHGHPLHTPTLGYEWCCSDHKALIPRRSRLVNTLCTPSENGGLPQTACRISSSFRTVSPRKNANKNRTKVHVLNQSAVTKFEVLKSNVSKSLSVKRWVRKRRVTPQERTINNSGGSD